MTKNKLDPQTSAILKRVIDRLKYICPNPTDTTERTKGELMVILAITEEFIAWAIDDLEECLDQ